MIPVDISASAVYDILIRNPSSAAFTAMLATTPHDVPYSDQ